MTLGVLNTHKYIIFINHKYLSIIATDIYDRNVCFDAKNRLDLMKTQFQPILGEFSVYLYYDG